MATRSASARLRHAFKYPSDDTDSDDPELDEEHQEALIASLQAEDAAKNTLYRKAFLAIPLSAALFYLYTFLFYTRSVQQALLSILSLSSLGCTAYILHFMPVEPVDKKGKTAVYRLEAAKGPVERYLVVLDAALAGVLVLASVVSWRKGAQEDAWREVLPAVIMGLIMFARQQLAPVDIAQLQRAQYDYKGA
ncbi:hypothetical protein B0A50_07494 [Salinomyces thailandicus]|uniref:Uncharacterized protein n=1 Tax=Salinomyces thailandicus TaxID=706561 RepID=A0A4U0TNH0_9PEZI|nr:hypothetical protein B0A50_07494 [Salinomyces thailandica]